MQAFGLDSLQLQKVTAVEQEILEERASALGITGRRLAAALAEFRRQCQGGGEAKRHATLVTGISNTLQE